MIDFNFHTDNKLQSGSILLSEPFLNDDYFSRSVILLCDHSEEGSFGFVLNKFVDTKISDFVEGFPAVTTNISIGGPVDTANLFYIHSLGSQIKNCVPASKGLFIGGDFNDIKKALIDQPEKENKIRFFIGYSGWEKNQLTEELASKAWIVLNNVNNEQILDTKNENIWKETLEKLGGKFKLMAQFPINPSDN
jgi:putative transcriptional regulator